MKNTLIIVALALTAVVYGCGKSADTQTSVAVPIGSFTGKFTRLHLKKSTNKVDTASAIITLTTTSKGLFKVTGDTSTVHAGSHGNFGVYSIYLQFADSTATAAISTSSKIHLHGTYQSYYDGSVFQLSASNDTLSVFYDLKKN